MKDTYLILVCVYSLISLTICDSQESTETITESIPSSTSTERAKWTDTISFTPAERKALDKFRPMISHLHANENDMTDAHLIRWLRAKDLDVNRAAEAFHDVQKWRKANKVDGLDKEDNILELRPAPYLVEGFDREGNPVVLFRLDSLDTRKLVVGGWRDKVTRYAIQLVERARAKQREASEIFGKNITQLTAIMDFQGFNLRQHFCLQCIPVGIDFLLLFQNYYPGILKHWIVINVPRVALPMIDLLKVGLSTETQRILHIFPADRKQWTQYITKIVAPDQLPLRFGGTKKG